MPRPDKSHGQEDRMLVHEDEKARALYLREMQLVPPEVGIFDEPTRCYRVNVEWAKIIMGMVSWLAEVAPWRDADDEGYFAIEEILLFMRGGNCGDDGMFKLMQNPANLCQLLQSLDGGETWEIAYDYSLCEEDVQIAPDVPAAVDDYYDFLGAWDNDPLSIAPSMEYDSTPEDDIRDLALCNALQDMVKVMCEMELEKRQQYALGLKIGSIFLTLVGLVVTVTTFGTGSLFYVGLASALLGLAGALWDGISDIVLSNASAQELVACCMYDSLAGATITQMAFESSLASCGFTGGSPEAQIAGAIAGTLDADGIFATFLEGLERSYRFAKLGVVDCPCGDDDSWEHTILFTNSSGHGWTILNGTQQTSYIRSAANPGLSNEQDTQLLFTWGTTTQITSIEYDAYFANNRISSATEAHIFIGGLETSDVLKTALQVGSGVSTPSVSFSGDEPARRIRLRNVSRVGAENRIIQVTIAGYGFDPFA